MNNLYYYTKAGASSWLVVDEEQNCVHSWWQTKAEADLEVNRLLKQRLENSQRQSTPPLAERGFGV